MLGIGHTKGDGPCRAGTMQLLSERIRTVWTAGFISASQGGMHPWHINTSVLSKETHPAIPVLPSTWPGPRQGGMFLQVPNAHAAPEVRTLHVPALPMKNRGFPLLHGRGCRSRGHCGWFPCVCSPFLDSPPLPRAQEGWGIVRHP